MSLFEHPEFADHQQVSFFSDQASGLKAVIAVHNTNLGPALGGCRMWNYASSAEALNDVLRLSKGMTYKAAMAELKLGGGKSVIIGDPRTQKSPAMMEAMGRCVESFMGNYITAEDSGISVDDLKLMEKHSQNIAGTRANYSYDGGESDGNPAPSTAYGVFVGLKASVAHRLNRNLKGVKVAIQGLGHVGYRLAKHLHSEGAELFVTDIFPDNLDKAATELGAKIVDPKDIFSQDVDVFAPCALGASINEETIPLLKASVIAGAANNQLAFEHLGGELAKRDILYAPDYVINAGGVIDIYHQRMDSDATALRAHIERIGVTLNEIYERAGAENKATNNVANAIAEERFGLN
ncbi:Glu/Leu/Phe/Val dehydrogenase [Alteromonadaceae bacterium M269]|nr:Glu/Leu/Phe/Val dehydrogenase [Alteromonadaceae bacterium M269]